MAHPFIAELVEGRLPREKFLFYLAQDAIQVAPQSFLRRLSQLEVLAISDPKTELTITHLPSE